MLLHNGGSKYFNNNLIIYNSSCDLKDRNCISSFTNKGCSYCENNILNDEYKYKPTSCKFYIYEDDNDLCIHLYFTKGKWYQDHGYPYGATEYESDSDIISKIPYHCHKRGQGHKIFSVKNQYLDELKAFCKDHDEHISRTFKEYLEKNFPIKF